MPEPVWAADQQQGALRPEECPMCGEGWPESQELRWQEYDRIKCLVAKLHEFADWAETYDGEIAGRLRDVLEGHDV